MPTTIISASRSSASATIAPGVAEPADVLCGHAAFDQLGRRPPGELAVVLGRIGRVVRACSTAPDWLKCGSDARDDDASAERRRELRRFVECPSGLG